MAECEISASFAPPSRNNAPQVPFEAILLFLSEAIEKAVNAKLLVIADFSVFSFFSQADNHRPPLSAVRPPRETKGRVIVMAPDEQPLDLHELLHQFPMLDFAHFS
jgi:hypothetical protein